MKNGRFRAKNTPLSINKAIDRANNYYPHFCGEQQDIVIYDEQIKGAIMSRGSYYKQDTGQITWGSWQEY